MSVKSSHGSTRFNEKTEIIEIQQDSDLKDTFETGISLDEFWDQMAISFPKILDLT